MSTGNPILATDSYKASHFLQYPPGTRHVFSYIESRGGAFDRTVVFGLQAFLKAHWSAPITMAMVAEAEELLTAHGEPFHRQGWERIVTAHGGRLPLLVRAVPEGTVLPTGNVMATVQNTDPELPWLTSYVETALLRGLWYPTTVATVSWHAKRTIRHYLDLTAEDPEGQIGFKLHDFGARGVSSGESAALGGLAHLVNFQGTDTVEALVAARRFYGEPMAGFSIPAAEHSTITAWGREGEVEAYRNMLARFGAPGKILAVVSDSYDLDHAVRALWGGELREAVLASGATLVVRPDSGEPAEVVLRTVQALAESFGATANAKGFRVLHPAVRVIQGDGINGGSIQAILARLYEAGFSAENVAFGMGGALLQQVNRDTLRFAMKASAIQGADGAWRPVFKAPKDDPAKRSKAGLLALVREDGAWRTVARDGHAWQDELLPVFRDGALLKDWRLAEVRARAALG